MKALTIKQPWASLIIYGHSGVLKDIENRDWPAPRYMIGKRVVIHSSKRLDPDEVEWAGDMIETIGGGWRGRMLPEMPCGCGLGTVEIVDCVTESESPWFVGDYGFVLRNPKPFDRPIPARGALGFWEWKP